MHTISRVPKCARISRSGRYDSPPYKKRVSRYNNKNLAPADVNKVKTRVFFELLRKLLEN